MTRRTALSRSPGGAGPDPVEAVLFDVDGTLADTLPDLAAAMNAAISEHAFPPLPARRYRGAVTGGSRTMMRTALGRTPEPELAEAIRLRFLAAYAARIVVHTRLFPGMEALLLAIESRGLPWGIVTNKPHDLTRRLLDALGIADRPSCVVCGDRVAHAKPHPEPLLHASRLLRIPPAHCLFVGDSPDDIAAGRAAAVRTLVARYGYLPDGDDASGWDAHGHIENPLDLLGWLDPGRE